MRGLEVIVSSYAVVGLVALVVVGLALLGAALWHPKATLIKAPASWGLVPLWLRRLRAYLFILRHGDDLYVSLGGGLC